MSTREHAHDGDAMRMFPRCSECRKVGFSSETPSCTCGGILEMITMANIRDSVTLGTRVAADRSSFRVHEIDWTLWVAKSAPVRRKRISVEQPPILTLEEAKRLTRGEIKEARNAFRSRWRI